MLPLVPCVFPCHVFWLRKNLPGNCRLTSFPFLNLSLLIQLESNGQKNSVKQQGIHKTKKAFSNYVMLIKQSFRVHQISPHVAEKEKRLYILNLQKLIDLHFDVNNQEVKQFGLNQDFAINTLINLNKQINVAVLLLFSTGTLKGYHPQVFGLCSCITGKNYTSVFTMFSFIPCLAIPNTCIGISFLY